MHVIDGVAFSCITIRCHVRLIPSVQIVQQSFIRVPTTTIMASPLSPGDALLSGKLSPGPPQGGMRATPSVAGLLKEFQDDAGGQLILINPDRLYICICVFPVILSNPERQLRHTILIHRSLLHHPIYTCTSSNALP